MTCSHDIPTREISMNNEQSQRVIIPDINIDGKRLTKAILSQLDLRKIVLWQFSAIQERLDLVYAQDDADFLENYKLVMKLSMGAKMYEALPGRTEEAMALYVIDCSLEGSRRQDFVRMGSWLDCLRFIEKFGLRNY